MKILITGINGFIGQQFKYFFLNKKFKVFGITSKNKNTDFKILLRKKIRPDVIIHSAGSGIVGVNDISYNIHKKKNLGSTRELISYIKKIKLKNCKIIFFSSQAVYGRVSEKKISEKNKTRPISHYGKTKLLAEKELKKIKDNSVVVLRLFSIYGKGLKKQIIWDACNKMKLKKPVFKGTGLEIRDFLSVRDLKKLVISIIKIKTDEYEFYNVGSGKGISIKILINKIKFYYSFQDKIKFISKSNTAEKQNYISENKKVQKRFNWKPTSLLNLEIKKYVNWFKKINEN